MKVEKVIGFILILLASVTLFEANRLRATAGLKYNLGPATFPFFVGGALILLGFYFVWTGGRQRKTSIRLPKKSVAQPMIITMAVMIGYGLLLPFFGYSLSTLVASILLFKVIGKYNWFYCFIIGVIVTTFLVIMFQFVVLVPFPRAMILD